MKEMETKKFICESCGGLLTIDNAKQTAVCQFCGMVYDYSYFNEIDALEKADNFMATGEFSAAGDALTFLQKKDPHNPKVLERLMLVSYKLKSLSDLNNKNTLDSISGDPKDTEWILDEAQGDSREQLVRLHGKIESAFKAARINKEILKVREDIELTEKRRDEMQRKITGSTLRYSEYGDDMHPKDYWKKNLTTLLLVWLVLMLLNLPVFFAKDGTFVAILILSMYSVVIFSSLLVIWFKNVKPVLQDIGNYEKRRDEYAAEAEKLKAREHELLNEYNALRRDIKKD